MEAIVNLPHHFESWKARITRSSDEKVAFEKWLFIQIAGVLFKKKAGKLLTLPVNLFGLNSEERLRLIAALSRSWRYSYLLLHQNAASDKVIIYDPDDVRVRLTEIPPCVLCEELGYPMDIEPAEFLAEVRRRWKEQGEIPHEIGLALGYPLKDVLGFMGLLPLSRTGHCGWCIYGDPVVSRKISHEWLLAQRQAIWFLNRNQSPDLVVKQKP